MRRSIASVLVVVSVALAWPRARGADPFHGADPRWQLLHEPALIAELHLTPARLEKYQDLLDEVDLAFFPLRNQPAETAAKGANALLGDTMRRLDEILTPAQMRRFAQLETRSQGTVSLLRDDVAGLMRYSATQRTRLEAAISEVAAATARLQERLADGERRSTLEEEHATLKENELKAVKEILTPAQMAIWQRLLGPAFDLSSLGMPTYRAPDLIDSGAWLNSQPLGREDLAGKVVVVHFYAFGCSNCVNNYPTYLAWQRRYRDSDVVIVGIHTPETAAEEELESVTRKAREAGFEFPVLVDIGKANWNAWGNSMWPSVYLVDKRGRLRFFWPGELRWKGATGDEWMAARIDDLLREAAGPSPGPRS